MQGVPAATHLQDLTPLTLSTSTRMPVRAPTKSSTKRTSGSDILASSFAFSGSLSTPSGPPATAAAGTSANDAHTPPLPYDVRPPLAHCSLGDGVETVPRSFAISPSMTFHRKGAVQKRALTLSAPRQSCVVCTSGKFSR
eukprot:scaffold5048_cov338-Prasinococcus_capsulatus_cf.AAC.14